MIKKINLAKAIESEIVSGVFLGFSRPQPCKELNFAMLSVPLSRAEENFKALEALGLNWRECLEEREDGYSVYDPYYICGVAKESLHDALELSCLEWQEGTLLVGTDRFMATEKPFRYESEGASSIGLHEVTGSKSGLRKILLPPAFEAYANLDPDHHEEVGEEKLMDLDVTLNEPDGLLVANLWRVWRNTFEYIPSSESGSSGLTFKLRPSVPSIIKQLDAYEDSSDNLFWSLNWDFDSFSDLNKVWNARSFFVFDDD